MGQHYIPQHHLRKFATSSEPTKIWMYDKCSDEFKLLPIRNVAQSSDFYSAGDERTLSQKIEDPVTDPLMQLRDGMQVDLQSRRAVAMYLESMIKRVPYTRRKMIAMIPQEKQDLLARIKRNPEKLASKLNLTPTALLREVKEWDQEFSSSSLSIKDDNVRRQWSSKKVVDHIFHMTWRIIRANLSHRFLTGDNPVFFDEGYGLKFPDGEFSFPFASDVALHGSWQESGNNLTWVDARPAIVKEFNRRVVFSAERFVFYHQKATWVEKLAENPRLMLNRIKW